MLQRARRTERSITDLVVDIGRDLQDIARAELRLAEWEARERLQSAAARFVTGALGCLLSACFVELAILYALRTLMPPWAAALCVAIADAVLAFAALKLGLVHLRIHPAPKAAHQIKEDLRWAARLPK